VRIPKKGNATSVGIVGTGILMSLKTKTRIWIKIVMPCTKIITGMMTRSAAYMTTPLRLSTKMSRREAMEGADHQKAMEGVGVLHHPAMEGAAALHHPAMAGAARPNHPRLS
jgi:hypothetical protein